ncbi:MAG: TetR/AcrR family transcriptional regulator [Marinibacterium sp.]|nr:TetR/AcrR family transcriptional regulator [Marinibacterium sp.]
MKERSDTKKQMVDIAARLFADRGFYGVSIANIADELNLTKQALIHHFGTKEKLYGKVLETIATRVAQHTTTVQDGDPQDRLEAFFEAFAAYAISHPNDTRLLMRELLDNKRRAEEAAHWCLEPFLRNLVLMVQATPRWHNAPEPQALAVAYQLLGAVKYFVVSEPTLSRLFGVAQFAEMQDIYPGELRRTVRALLAG